MAECRGRGGRSAPRYHHIRDAAEDRLWRLLHRQEQEQEPEVERTVAEQAMERLAIYSLAMDSALAIAREKMEK